MAQSPPTMWTSSASATIITNLEWRKSPFFVTHVSQNLRECVTFCFYSRKVTQIDCSSDTCVTKLCKVCHFRRDHRSQAALSWHNRSSHPVKADLRSHSDECFQALTAKDDLLFWCLRAACSTLAISNVYRFAMLPYNLSFLLDNLPALWVFVRWL